MRFWTCFEFKTPEPTTGIEAGLAKAMGRERELRADPIGQVKRMTNEGVDTPTEDWL